MLLILKLILTPVLMMSLTLAGKRWGQTVSGLFAGLPLNSGPISFLFALQYGTPFAAQAAVGSMGGMIGVAMFAFAYATLAHRASWFVSVVVAEIAYFAIIYLLNVLSLPLLPTTILSCIALGLILWQMPPRTGSIPPLQLGKWDLPARIVAATLFVLVITALGTILGPQLGGLASTFPIFATVLSVFAHRQQGPHAANEWLRGVVVGMYATIAFYIVIGVFVTMLPVYATYLLAVVAALGINGAALYITRLQHRSGQVLAGDS